MSFDFKSKLTINRQGDRGVMEEIKPKDLMLGNFFDSMGNIELVTEIIRQGEDSWYVGHKGWNKKLNPIPDEIQYTPYAIPLSEEWKKCLNIDKFEGLPDRIKYVHQAQNYFRIVLGIELLEIMDWKLLPK